MVTQVIENIGRGEWTRRGGFRQKVRFQDSDGVHRTPEIGALVRQAGLTPSRRLNPPRRISAAVPTESVGMPTTQLRRPLSASI